LQWANALNRSAIARCAGASATTFIKLNPIRTQQGSSARSLNLIEESNATQDAGIIVDRYTGQADRTISHRSKREGLLDLSKIGLVYATKNLVSRA
jgi:hypothetical protein